MALFNSAPSVERDPTQESRLANFYTCYRKHDYRAASKELKTLGEETIKYLKRANPIYARTLSFRGLFPKI